MNTALRWIIAGALVMSSGRTSASEPPMNAVGVDVLVAIVSPAMTAGNELRLLLEYERGLNANVSAYVQPEARISRGVGVSVDLAVAAGVRWYPVSDAALRGWWLGAELGVRGFLLSESEGPSPRLAVGLSTGYNILVWNHVAVSVGIRAHASPFIEVVPRGMVQFVF